MYHHTVPAGLNRLLPIATQLPKTRDWETCSFIPYSVFKNYKLLATSLGCLIEFVILLLEGKAAPSRGAGIFTGNYLPHANRHYLQMQICDLFAFCSQIPNSSSLVRSYPPSTRSWRTWTTSGSPSFSISPQPTRTINIFIATQITCNTWHTIIIAYSFPLFPYKIQWC
jgi:hypothetical protein